MSTLGKLARGLATGLAGYHGQLYQEQLEDRKARVLAEKDAALEMLRSRNRKEEATHIGNVNAGLKEVETNERIRETRALLPDKTKAEIEVNEAEAKARADAAEVAFRRELEKLEKQHGFTLAEKDKEHQLQLARDRAARNEEVGHVDVSVDGKLVTIAKSGRMISESKPGTYNPTRQPRVGDDEDEDIKSVIARMDRERGAGAAKTEAAAAREPVQTSAEQAQPRPGQTASDGRGNQLYWNGRTWVPLTPGNRAEQQRLITGG